MKNPLIQIDDFKGGMTLNDKMGRKDQFHTGSQIDFSSKVGYIAPGYGWTVMMYSSSQNLPTEYQSILYAMKDGNYYFGGEDTKIYKQTNSTTIDVEHDSTQAGKIRSLVEYNGYMLYIQDTTIGTSDLAGTPVYVDNFKTGLTNDTYHPLFISANKTLYFGHGQYVGSGTDPSNSATFTLNALDLEDNWKVRTLCDFGWMYLAIGINFGTDNPSKAKVVLWDRVSSSWVDEIAIPEREIKAMIFDSGYLWVWAGRSCNLYVVPESSRKATKVWSFVKEKPSASFEVYPNAVSARNGTIYFGLSGVDSYSYSINPTGIYSFPADPNKFSLNITKKGDGYNERYKSLCLIRGAEGSSGDMFYTGWRNYMIGGSEYNRISREKTYDSDTSPYVDGSGIVSIWESFKYEAPKNKKMMTEAFLVRFKPLPTNTTTALYYKKDDDSDWTSVFTSFSTTNAFEKLVYKTIICHSLKLKLELTGSTSAANRQFVESITVTGGLTSKV